MDQRPNDESCLACDVPLQEGDEVLNDVSGGIIHARCCGPERESYVGEDGEPLKDGEPIPKPWKWSAQGATATELAQQREDRERAAERAELASREGQAKLFRETIKQALNATNLEIAGQGAQPRIDSVIQSLTMLQAEFVAMEPQRNTRRMRIAEISHNLKQLVSLHAGMGQKPAKPLGPVN